MKLDKAYRCGFAALMGGEAMPRRKFNYFDLGYALGSSFTPMI